MQWIKKMDQTMFLWCNQRFSRPSLDRLFGWITHLGGAIFTILSAVILAWFTADDFNGVGIQCLITLTLSHVIAVLIKKLVRRVRPFRMLEHVKVGKFPLKDYSFPSGHTTAIFALVTPLFFASTPLITILLLGLAIAVGFSRIYWGYHYPLDCLAGGMLGFLTGGLVVSLMNT